MPLRMWNDRNSSLLLVKMQNCTDTVEDTLAVPYESKHNLLQNLTIPTSYLAKCNECVPI